MCDIHKHTHAALHWPEATDVQRILGRDEGKFEVPEDFDAPLPVGIIWAD